MISRDVWHWLLITEVAFWMKSRNQIEKKKSVCLSQMADSELYEHLSNETNRSAVNYTKLIVQGRVLAAIISLMKAKYN